ncbi:MAG TPA: threonylcarbamoyl-AMP synthase, partial [Bacteroidetes bacterium]|nr:threonylcarbamoyl-AMP synthase [Bacteroidota bacterium]
MVIATLKRHDAPAWLVRELVKRLERGEVLLLPTDTVYGLHASARNRTAVQRIRRIKGIEADRPLTVLAGTAVDIGRWVVLPEGQDRRLVVGSWPGAVTWVLPAREEVPESLRGPDDTLGIRIPDHALLRMVCAGLDDLIVSSSANLHGEPPPATEEEVDQRILAEVDGAVFEETPLPGKPSEVKRWTPAGPDVLRTRISTSPPKDHPVHILIVCSGNTCRSPMAEAALREHLNKLAPGRFLVRSAGTLAQRGMHATLQAVEAMREHGLDLGEHRSRPVTESLMEWADIVLAMTTDHLGELHELYPQHSEKVYLLSAYPEEQFEGRFGVEDPIG